MAPTRTFGSSYGMIGTLENDRMKIKVGLRHNLQGQFSTAAVMTGSDEQVLLTFMIV